MPIVRRELANLVWETPQKMITDFIDNYELILEGQPNQIIYGRSFPSSSPDSLFVYTANETVWLYRNGAYLQFYPHQIGTIVPFFGNPGAGSQANVASSANPSIKPWALCDGNTYNGRATPDLRGRGFIGVDPSDSGAENEGAGFMHGSISTLNVYAGADLVKLKEEHLPVHGHYYSSPEDIAKGGQTEMTYTTRQCQSTKKSQNCWDVINLHPQSKLAQTKITSTRYTSSINSWDGKVVSFAATGSDSPRQVVHNNLPPYIVLNWKMYVGY